ncbi:MAG TPA: DUF4430 domain-containing protein [Candidatus Binatia bacterium]|jgi:hypothetical protein|nr:DUF4430 domain-containing protein [Candidatus Binatia bacterium]
MESRSDSWTWQNQYLNLSRMIAVTVTIDFGSAPRQPLEATVTLTHRSTVLDALQMAAPVVTSHKFGMDHFVEEIDGIKNDFARDLGWHFEVNGYRSNIPAERYLIKDRDWIKWIYLSEV